MAEPPNGVPEIDVTTPNTARMYDYLLGGMANFAQDREAGEQIIREFPTIVDWAWANRGFLARAVRTLVTDYGIDQFLDLGSGIPTVGNVHEIVQQENPNVRVAYVDIEPVASHHARHVLDGNDRATMTLADLREPEHVLHADGVADLLDFTRPIAVLTVAIFDIISVEDPTTLLAAYRDACAPGSALVLSHAAQLHMTEDDIDSVRSSLHNSTTPHARWRSREQLRNLFAGYELIEPGVVPSSQWRPGNHVSDEQAKNANAYAAVGILP